MRTGCPMGAARTVLEQTSGMGSRLPWHLDRRLPLAASGLLLAVSRLQFAARRPSVAEGVHPGVTRHG